MTKEEAIEIIRDARCTSPLRDALETLIPELRESEDERIRKGLIEVVSDIAGGWPFEEHRITKKEALAYLEKRKEATWIPTDEQRTALGMILKHSDPDADSTKVLESLLDELTKIANPKVAKWKEKQKEQKPDSTEDMPYITDEHFYEREPADSFKYKLAEYMTKNCRREKGPNGYTYGISAESILKMAEEELLKRGVVQKPEERFKEAREKYQVEWSKEDEKTISDSCCWLAEYAGYLMDKNYGKASMLMGLTEKLKSLRPQPHWKPSEEKITNLRRAEGRLREDFKALRNWLVGHDYYVGNHEVAKALRKLADMWDD